MLTTTSRYAPNGLRELAKALALVFSGEYAARGKKTFDSLVDYARRKGHSRICVVSSDGIDFAAVDELGNWRWMDERIAVIKSKVMLKGLGCCRIIEGEDSARLSELSGFEGNEKAEEAMLCGKGQISFPASKPSLTLEVKYEKQVQHNG